MWKGAKALVGVTASKADSAGGDVRLRAGEASDSAATDSALLAAAAEGAGVHMDGVTSDASSAPKGRSSVLIQDGLVVGRESAGVAVGDGVGVGDVNVLPSNEPGFVLSGADGRDVVAFELNATQRPSLLITGRELTIRIRTLFCAVGSPALLKRTFFVSVI